MGGESSVSQSKERVSESGTFGIVSKSATHSASILLCVNYALLRTLMFQAYTYVPMFQAYIYVPMFQAYTYVPMF